MRFIFVGFPTTVFPEMIQVAKSLREKGHRIVHWIRASGFAPDLPKELKSLVDFKWNYEWSDRSNPWLLNDMERFLPLDANDLALFAPHEASMLDLLQRIYPRYSTPELTHYYHLYLRCWKGLFKELRPDVIVFRTLPHEPTNAIIRLLARFHGIKTLMFYQLWLSDRILPMEDFTLSNTNLGLLNNQTRNDIFDDLSPDLQEYYQSQTKDTEANLPVYMPDLLSSYTVIGQIFSRLRSLFFGQVHRDFRGRLVLGLRTLGLWLRSRLSNQLPRAHRRFVSPSDFSKPFIYFPLHYQPELSTNPLGGYFRDQLLALELMVISLPQDWEIYVKEHPTQWLVGGNRYSPYRPKDYYSSLARFPSVRLIPINSDSFELIRKAKVVATISGTAGWEAVLRGKPALVFGYPWYQHAPGVHRVNDLVSCRVALKKVADGEVPDPQAVLHFLKRLDEVSFRGCLDLEYRSNSNFFKLAPSQQAENVLESILKNTKQSAL